MVPWFDWLLGMLPGYHGNHSFIRNQLLYQIENFGVFNASFANSRYKGLDWILSKMVFHMAA